MGEPRAVSATARLTNVSDSGVDLSAQVFREVAESVPPIDWDDWELGQQMRRVRRLASTSASPPRHQAWDPQNVVRYDASHGFRATTTPPTETPAPKPAPDAPPKMAGRRPGTWFTLALGLATSACGGLLTAKSLVEGRGDLWSVGLPLLAAGQSLLVVGLALQLVLGGRSARRPTAHTASRQGPSPVVQTPSGGDRQRRR